MLVDGMEEVVEGAGYVSELVLPIVDSRCYLLSESRQLCLSLSLELSL